MKTSKTHFEEHEKGIALEEARDRQVPFYENTDGTSYVPEKRKKKKKKTVTTKIRKTRSKR